MENTITNIRVNKTSSYGRFEVTGQVNGMDVKTFTTDSMNYDYQFEENCNTEEELENHHYAMKALRWLLNEAYEYLTNN